MAEQPREKTERNQQLIEDFKSGMSLVDLVSKYRITSQRIYKIVSPKQPRKKHELRNI